ncbi:DNA repair helicase, putative [Trypanosoma brucei brucei TREU927]|uniref:DNA repair helicase, putative n=1 Tax=Trypanosoma brucei brucei (strain 927/4 GUTat10.1) TaxID=185431 RepID=Q38BP4_TRYB2|nr:DNA repair helicase, putative [Trypanosoma brucei brucei TREU927]EAN77776.1 DNA repair helicase, putative [Trypanosoma brucei brucei TREU927]
MYAAGRFTVPFPFEPYPLQLHAMEAIREGLSAGDVVVLESPTGTGKTQILLNGVLSHMFEPVVTSVEHGIAESHEVTGESRPTGEVCADSGDGCPSFEEHRKHQRKRRKREREKRRKETFNFGGTSSSRDPFLVDQDVREEAQELSRCGALADCLSSSSSSRSSSVSHLGGEGDKSDEDVEVQPLRKPKVYFSSRTHTQLQQVTDELRRTVFCQNLVRRRSCNSVEKDGLASKVFEDAHKSPFVEPRKLRYVHVAGRQQLCLNASLKAAAGGSNERLNELCLEAMAYEYSKEGKTARKQKLQRGCADSSLPDIEDSLGSSTVSRRGCGYCQKEKLKILRDYVNIEPRDLSQMRELGQRVGACPFLVTREVLRGADVVFIPYSYLVSSEMRNALLAGNATNEHPTDLTPQTQVVSQGLSSTCRAGSTSTHSSYPTVPSKQRWEIQNGRRVPILPPDFSGDVIVVDEAHNLVDYCRNVTTAEVTLPELQVIRRLLDGYRLRYEKRLLTRNKQRLREMVAFVDKLAQHLQEAGKKSTPTATASTFINFTFDAEVDTVNVHLFLSFLDESRLLPKLHGLLAQMVAQVEAQISQPSGKTTKWRPTSSYSDENICSDTTNEYADPIEALLHSPAEDRRSIAATLYRFETFLRWYGLSDEYTRVILRRLPSENGSREMCRVTLELLQLELGTHTMFPVLQQAHAAVLAGGTMKPLALTCDLLLKQSAPTKELSVLKNISSLPCGTREEEAGEQAKKIRFTEEGHVVPPSSIAVFTLATGPGGQRLEFQHARRQSWPKIFEGVGTALLNFCRVIPAGMIVFFTSYEIEELFVNTIRSSGMYDTINAVKRIFREPGSARNASSTPGYSSGCQAAASTTVDSMLEEYASWIRSERSSGALLFAVIGGKLSEGINFNDDLGRAVVVVGLPYANISEVDLQLHLRHVADTRVRTLLPSSANIATGSITTDSTDQVTVVPDGEFPASPSSAMEWGLLTDLCMRSVNQSIGRCIRHASDYAAVILLDARYVERRDIRRRIPSWMQPSIHVAQNFGDCFRRVRDFFIERRK